MSLLRLAIRSATFYWRTNLAVLLGVSAAVAVLGGALLVGDSVRGSLRDIALGGLGKADQALSSAQFFREDLAEAVRTGGGTAAPLIVSTGFVTHEPSGRRAGSVVVYAVDAGVVGAEQLAVQLKIIGWVGKDEIDARFRQPPDFFDAIADDDLVQRKPWLPRPVRKHVPPDAILRSGHADGSG